MSQFNLTARLNLQGPYNVKSVVSKLRNELKNIKVDVKVNIDPNTNAKIIALNKSISDLGSNLKGIASLGHATSKGLNSIAQVGNNVNRSAKAIAKSQDKIVASTSKATQALSGARSEMEEFGRVSGLAIRRFAGFTLATGAIFGLINSITEATKASINFERELVKVGQVTKTGLGGLTDLTDEITRLSTSLGVGSASLLTASRTLSQAGLSALETRRALEALARSSLAPTFDDITQTTEGVIAAMRQFKLEARDLSGVLGSINAVAGQFAVESGDIINAIRRTGGVFAAASGVGKEDVDAKKSLREFIALFTSVRATTRESAESIATGLRTIFTRLQRRTTIDGLKALGIELETLDGKFVGPFNAITRLNAALGSLDPQDLRFAQIVEELGGFRQIGKVIPLLQQTDTALQALKVAEEGQNSVVEDSITAQDALAVRFEKTREKFAALLREVTGSDTFNLLAKGALNLADSLINIADSISPVIPLLATLGAIKTTTAATKFVRGFRTGVLSNGQSTQAQQGNTVALQQNTSAQLQQTQTQQNAQSRAAQNTAVLSQNTGALSALTTEVRRLIGTLSSSNLGRTSTPPRRVSGRGRGFSGGGRVQRFATGGPVIRRAEGSNIPEIRKGLRASIPKSSGVKKLLGTVNTGFNFGAAYLRPPGISTETHGKVSANSIKSQSAFFKVAIAGLKNPEFIRNNPEVSRFNDALQSGFDFNFHHRSISEQVGEEVEDRILKGFVESIGDGSAILAKYIPNVNPSDTAIDSSFLKGFGVENILGHTFEAMLAKAGNKLDKVSSARFDFLGGLGSLASGFTNGGPLADLPTDVKSTYNLENIKKLQGKADGYVAEVLELHMKGLINKSGLGANGKVGPNQVVEALGIPGASIRSESSTIADRINKGKLASGGNIDNTIPALTMPGELIFGPQSAHQIGEKNLRAFNETGDPSYLGSFNPNDVTRVPGSGNADTFRTNIPEGSFVIRKDSAESLSGGFKSTRRFAAGGRVSRFATGGGAEGEDLDRRRTLANAEKALISLGLSLNQVKAGMEDFVLALDYGTSAKRAFPVSKFIAENTAADGPSVQDLIRAKRAQNEQQQQQQQRKQDSFNKKVSLLDENDVREELIKAGYSLNQIAAAMKAFNEVLLDTSKSIDGITPNSVEAYKTAHRVAKNTVADGPSAMVVKQAQRLREAQRKEDILRSRVPVSVARGPITVSNKVPNRLLAVAERGQLAEAAKTLVAAGASANQLKAGLNAFATALSRGKTQAEALASAQAAATNTIATGTSIRAANDARTSVGDSSAKKLIIPPSQAAQAAIRKSQRNPGDVQADIDRARDAAPVPVLVAPPAPVPVSVASIPINTGNTSQLTQLQQQLGATNADLIKALKIYKASIQQGVSIEKSLENARISLRAAVRKRENSLLSQLKRTGSNIGNKLNNSALLFGAFGAAPILQSLIGDANPHNAAAGAGLTGGVAGAFAGSQIGAAAGPLGSLVGLIGGGLVGAVTSATKAFEETAERIRVSKLDDAINNFQSAVENASVGIDNAAISEASRNIIEQTSGHLNKTNNLDLYTNKEKLLFAYGLSPLARSKGQAEKDRTDELFNISSAGANQFKNFIERGLAQGKNEDKLIEQLGGDSDEIYKIIGTLNKQALQRAVERPQQADNILIHAGQDIINATQTRINTEQLLKSRIESSTRVIDLLGLRLVSLADSASIAANAGTKIRTQIESVSQGFEQIAGFSLKELSNNLSLVSQGDLDNRFKLLSGFTGGATGELQDVLNGVKFLRTEGVNILAKSSTSTAIGDSNNPEVIANQLLNSNDTFNGLNPILKEGFKNAIRGIFSNRQAEGSIVDLGKEIQQDPRKFIDSAIGNIGQEALSAFNNLNQSIQTITNEFTKNANLYIKTQIEAAELQDKINDLSSERALKRQELLGLNVTPGDVLARRNVRVGERAFFGGAGFTTDINSIGDRILKLREERSGLIARRDNATNPTDIKNITIALADNSQQGRQLEAALNILATDVKALAAVEKQLADLQQRRERGRNFVEKLRAAQFDPRAALELNKDIQNALAIGFGGPVAQGGFDGGNRLIKEIIGLLPNDQAKRANDALAGINFAGLGLDRNGAGAGLRELLIAAEGRPQEAALIQQFDRISAIQIEAIAKQQELIKANGAELKTLMSDLLNKQLATFQDMKSIIENSFKNVGNSPNSANAAKDFAELSSKMEGFITALANINIPEKIEIEAAPVNVNVNLNGADVLAGINPLIVNIVERSINRSIDRSINPITGETNIRR